MTSLPWHQWEKARCITGNPVIARTRRRKRKSPLPPEHRWAVMVHTRDIPRPNDTFHIGVVRPAFNAGMSGFQWKLRGLRSNRMKRRTRYSDEHMSPQNRPEGTRSV